MAANTMPGGRRKKVPFPQFDKPGSKISPFTGKPYTAAEAARVHGKTRSAGTRKERVASAAIERKLAAGKPKPKGGYKNPINKPYNPIASVLSRRDEKGRTLGDQYRESKAGVGRAVRRSPTVRNASMPNLGKLNPNNYTWEARQKAQKAKKRQGGHKA